MIEENLELKMKQTPNELVCKAHDATADFVITNPQINIDERLACQICQSEKGTFQGQKIQQILAIIKEEKQRRCEKIDQFLQESIKKSQDIEEKIDNFLEKLVAQVTAMKQVTTKLIESLTFQRKQNFEYCFFEELDIHVNKIDKSNDDNKKIMKIRKEIINSFGKLRKKFSSLPQDLDKISDKVLKSTRDFYKKNYEELYKPLELNLSQSINQRDPCYTLTFNNSNNLLFTGCGNKIKVWNFNEGNMQELTKLNGHILSVTSILTSSKIKNSFVSVGECGSLIIWKQKNEKQWESLKKQSQWANSMILNQDETQLIQATANCQIDIWDVDFEKNLLTFKYSLQDHHSNTIFDISLNKKETRMVSCDADNLILIWKKDNKDQQWTILQEIKQVTYGTKVFFITDDTFIWMGCDQKTNDQIFFYEQQRDNFQINLQKTFQLENDNQQIDFHLTPIIYNTTKKVFLLRFKRHVYLIQIAGDGEFTIITKLRYETNLIYATLSEDGKYLVTYIEDSKKYQIHEIKWT